MGLYWVGSRASDIKHTDNLFSGEIVLYGSKENWYALNNALHKRINNNCITKETEDFLYDSIKAVIASDANAAFYFYDPSWTYKMKKLHEFCDRFLCVNSESLYEAMNNKYNFRRFVDNKAVFLDAFYLRGSECNYETICRLFDKDKGHYIIQAPCSTGGEGTFLIDENNSARVIQNLDEAELYIITEYLENCIPVNIHCLIDQSQLLLFPGSVQILKHEQDKMLYRGCDYPCYLTIPEATRIEFESLCLKIAKKAQKNGYRGICGFDGIINHGHVFVTECNPRFQASTPLLNKALAEADLPCIQQLNLDAFNGKTTWNKDTLKSLTVGYSVYAYHNSGSQKFGNHILLNAGKDANVCEIDTDGYSIHDKIDQGIFMFRIIVKGNISCINPNSGIFVNELLVEPDMDIYNKICCLDVLAIKIALMSFGVRITEKAQKWLESNGGIRPGNNNAVDLELLDLIINAPLDIKYVTFTPFSIDLEGTTLTLFYYDLKVSNVSIYPLDPLSTKRTSRNVPYTTVAYLSTDRLRIHMTHECIFKTMHKSCQFCNIVPCEDPINIEDIQEVVKDYIFNSPGASHFLVGGQSMGQEAGRKRIIEMVEAIRKYEKRKHIYVMALPYDRETISALVNAGMNELSCNIEVFDDKLARKYMPGKGEIPRAQYYDVLSYAQTLLPEPEAVRSMVILGLEPDESFISGIRELAKRKIQPIVSVFRPLPDTPLESLIAPPLQYIYKMYCILQEICMENGMHLGPACVHCQNNTLSLPYSLIERER